MKYIVCFVLFFIGGKIGEIIRIQDNWEPLE